MFLRAIRFTNLAATRSLTHARPLLVSTQAMPFAKKEKEAKAPEEDSSQPSMQSQKRITTQTLCDITGTRYYEHNDEIPFPADKLCRVYDENDALVGDMNYGEAYQIAVNMEKDVVLRNAKTDPPIIKIMNYKLQLLKRLFKKLGRETAVEGKTKSIRLTTTISMHDLENKRRKSIEFLKQVSSLKFFMKVNVYDPENVQKGRLMLLNLAEDLKEYAKVKVAPD